MPRGRDVDTTTVPREAISWRRVAVVAATAWVLAGTLLGRFSTFIAFDPNAVGRAILEGSLPYADFAFEYPPGAALVLTIPSAIGPGAYELTFRLLMALAWMVLLLLVGRHAPAAVPGFLAGSAAMAFIIGGGFDIVVGLLVFVAYLALGREAQRRSSIWLGLGGLVKWVPLLLVPLLVRSRRAAFLGVAVVAAASTAVAVLVPALVSETGNDPISYHGERLLHAESTLGSAIVMKRILAGDQYPIVFEHGSRNIANASNVARYAAAGVAVAAIVAIWIVGAARAPETWMAVLLAVPALGPVASPQFLLWPIAFVGMVGRAPRWLFVGAAAVSSSMFAGLYPGEGTALATMTLLRNLVLVAAFLACVLDAVRLGRRVDDSHPATL